MSLAGKNLCFTLDCEFSLGERRFGDPKRRRKKEMGKGLGSSVHGSETGQQAKPVRRGQKVFPVT